MLGDDESARFRINLSPFVALLSLNKSLYVRSKHSKILLKKGGKRNLVSIYSGDGGDGGAASCIPDSGMGDCNVVVMGAPHRQRHPVERSEGRRL